MGISFGDPSQETEDFENRQVNKRSIIDQSLEMIDELQKQEDTFDEDLDDVTEEIQGEPFEDQSED